MKPHYIGAVYDVTVKNMNHLIEQLEEARRKLSIAQEALVWADQMFTARDEMNAKVHCAPLRLSPITERVKQALEALK
jgi:hypothetical protein